MAATNRKEDEELEAASKKRLFFCHYLSPSSMFFLPDGTRVYNKLIDLFRKHLYVNNAYEEVKSPNIFNLKLWETSGLAQNHKEKMILMEVDKQEFVLKPMNCPAHCLIFQHRVRSHNELPLRLVDFGALHLNEGNGSDGSMLTRSEEQARRYQQDDGHIFCKMSQIKAEVLGILKLIDDTYNKILRFDNYELKLHTRPRPKECVGGEMASWKKAEDALNDALGELKKPWQQNESEEGASTIYGPKIDIYVSDSLGRKFRCASLQLDLQLPARFKLEYSTKKEGKKKRPVLIHTTILGSIETMLGILLKRYKGDWPFWLNPRQVIVCSVSRDKSEKNHAKKLWKQIQQAGYYVDIDETDKEMNEKVEEAERVRYNYILVVGKEEVQNELVSVKMRDEACYSSMSIEMLLTHCNHQVASFQ